ncbi:MAG: NUDIX domain-containing protein [Planctomycetota bacterium]|nr:NUDIX domain-containing protein [Planctomycetota bacterium]
MAHDATEVIVRGLAVENGHVLLCRHVGKGYRYLPGGHVEFPEPARDALAREMDEEAGADIAAGDLLLTHEHVFRQKGKLRHEVNLVFAMRLDAGTLPTPGTHVPRGTSPSTNAPTTPAAPTSNTPTPAPAALPKITSQEPDIAFDWVPIAGLDDADVRPASMVGWIRAAASGHAPVWLSEIHD